MPRRKYTKKRRFRGRKRKRRVKKRKKRSMMARIPRMKIGQKTNWKILTYHEDVVLPATAFPLTSAYIFRSNSLFDPNYSGAGHQPMGFDEMMARYSYYRVFQTRIRVTVTNQLETVWSQAMGVVGIRHKEVVSYPGNPSQMIELNDSYYKRISHVNGPHNQVVLKMNVKPWKLEGLDFNASNNVGSVSTNPVAKAYFQIWQYNSDLTKNADAKVLSVRMDFVCKFDGPIDLLPS